MGNLSRREFMKRAGYVGAIAAALPVTGCATTGATNLYNAPGDADTARLNAWAREIRDIHVETGFSPAGIGRAAARVGELAIGTPYEAFTLEQYLKAGGDPTQKEPLTVSLTKFDCVTLVESCLGVARAGRKSEKPSWNDFAREVEAMRYRGGVRRGFVSRLHYFSEWIADGEERGLVHDLGKELGGVADTRPLRFMTEHRSSYPGLKDDAVYTAIGQMERSLDSHPRYFIPTDRISSISSRIASGDVLAFATSIAGLDVTHAAFAHRDAGNVLRVLHAPLSGGSVEISQRTLSDYVAAIRRSTGILVARPLG